VQVMLVHCPLKDTSAEEDKLSRPRKSKKGKGKEAAATTTTTVEEFLTKHRTAKIVVVIDTHCMDNGYFVYTGESPEQYQACSLKEVGIR
jgi:hypothetical protein